MDPALRTPPDPTRQRRPRKARRAARLPVTIRFGVPLLALGFVIWLLWSWWIGAHTTLVIRGPAGGAVSRATLSFFADDLSSAAPSPPPLLGELVLEDRLDVRVGRDLVPERALVRIAAEGFGVGFTTVRIGEGPTVFEPAATGVLDGLVLAGGKAAPDARVVLFGGGSRGVPLLETRTDDRGQFVLEGFDATLDTVTVRVLHAGHGVADVHRWLQQTDELVVDLEPTLRIAGRVLLSADLDALALMVVARSVPGAQIELAPDGSFELDHVPANLHPRLVVHGLPVDYTHHPVQARPGQQGVAIEISRATTVSGFVVDDMTGRAISAAAVLHHAGPQGLTGVQCGPDGSFTLGGVPPGTLVLTAQVPIPGAVRGEPLFRVGKRELTIVEGQPLENISIRVP